MTTTLTPAKLTLTVVAALAAALFAASTVASNATTANYTCEGGTRLTADFSLPGSTPGSVVLRFNGTLAEVKLPQVLSADGGRYANDRIEFWIKGNGATLTRVGRSETCHTT
jgi:membrane-bound inhibitor of C-type lysozyme